MWLLNHGTARAFELPMLRSLGYGQIFTPKRIPQEIGFRSGSVDWRTDEGLDIPADDLAVLNAADWYGEPGEQAWALANRHFDLAFFIVHRENQLRSMQRHFKGAAIWRIYGGEEALSQTHLLGQFAPGTRWPTAMGGRFWLGCAYEHLPQREGEQLARRSVFLPVGMPQGHGADAGPPAWTGTDARVLFVCPDIASNPYYQDIHRRFVADFGDLPHVVGGAQALQVDDPRVLGFVPRAEHERNMRELRLMFYHSREPYHLHYHPLEAIRQGMPLVFMAGGLLDRLGGIGQPGRCETTAQARALMQRLLAGDMALAEHIRQRQASLLAQLEPQACQPHWRAGLERIEAELERFGPREQRLAHLQPRRPRRIAILVPAAYRGGTLRSALLLAQALVTGSERAGEPVQVVIGYPRRGWHEAGEALRSPHPSISLRAYDWRELDQRQCALAMRFARLVWPAVAGPAWVPDDGATQFCDCDLWLLASDRVPGTLLPLRPHVALIHDFTQRHVVDPAQRGDLAWLDLARRARCVLVTSRFTADDAVQYAGVPAQRVVQVPLMASWPGDAEAPADAGACVHAADAASSSGGFLWPTNVGVHKNHEAAVQALRIYYDELGGQLECRICGVGTQDLPRTRLAHLKALAGLLREGGRPVRLLGELAERGYLQALAASRFVWNPARVDNGTYCVVEAACVGVPALSADYPAMRELAQAYALSVHWCDARSPRAMALALRELELHAQPAVSRPDRRLFGAQAHADAYWRVIRSHL